MIQNLEYIIEVGGIIAILGLLIFFVYLPGQMQPKLKKEAGRLAKEASRMFPELKSEPDSNVIRKTIFGKVFNKEALAQMPEKSRKRIEICCTTVNGFYYTVALDLGSLKGLINIRSIQFTEYLDKELELQGFPHQPLQQKKEILEAMSLEPAFENFLQAQK